MADRPTSALDTATRLMRTPWTDAAEKRTRFLFEAGRKG